MTATRWPSASAIEIPRVVFWKLSCQSCCSSESVAAACAWFCVVMVLFLIGARPNGIRLAARSDLPIGYSLPACPTPTILVIEDDPDIRGLVVALVERAGMRAREAADGRAGVRAFFEERPDLVVLDIGLPELDGWQVLERIRDLSEVPVLMLTAEGEQVQKVRGLEGGADDYVTKPFGREELVARIHALLRRGSRDGGGEETARRRRRHDRRSRAAGDGGRQRAGADADRVPAAGLPDAQPQPGGEPAAAAGGGVGNTDADPKQVRLYVSYLRRKLNAAGVDPIETVRGFGYRYRIAHPSRPASA